MGSREWGVGSRELESFGFDEGFDGFGNDAGDGIFEEVIQQLFDGFYASGFGGFQEAIASNQKSS
ncbi:hypothetical protein C7B76_25745 [filamentous cyanobacterium CCP2]|nr:hypothetical protein C7B76_25745 [filamentous cyanobacterium CCP2]